MHIGLYSDTMSTAFYSVVYTFKNLLKTNLVAEIIIAKKSKLQVKMFSFLQMKRKINRFRKGAVFLKRIYDISQTHFSSYIGSNFGIHAFFSS